MISQAELDRFFERLVTTVQTQGGVCAITSGMACVQYGVASATKDCDLLCSADSAGQLLNVLRVTSLNGVGCAYRGHLTPPLDPRWLRGGWTSHFHWDLGDAAAYLDVFGVAPRASSFWITEAAGTLTGMHIVAEMKRTDRPKDWPFATALGVKLLEDGDSRGWLHIFMSNEKPDWLTPETLTYLREVEYRFHVRAFGEEMARVNFLPLEQRKQYLYDILDHARRHGVKLEEPADEETA